MAADPPGPRTNPPGTAELPGIAELLCALSYGSGLAAAEQMEHGTNTAFVGVQLGRALGAGAGDLEAVFYGALVKDAGCGACGAVLARFFADDELALGSVITCGTASTTSTSGMTGAARLSPGTRR